MDDLKELHRASADDDVDEIDLGKIIGNPEAGKWIEIFWKDIDEEAADYTDEGYLFQAPYCDDDPDLLDFFVHVPNPDNSSGIGNAPAEWVHLKALIQNPLVTQVIVQK